MLVVASLQLSANHQDRNSDKECPGRNAGVTGRAYSKPQSATRVCLQIVCPSGSRQPVSRRGARASLRRMLVLALQHRVQHRQHSSMTACLCCSVGRLPPAKRKLAPVPLITRNACRDARGYVRHIRVTHQSRGSAARWLHTAEPRPRCRRHVISLTFRTSRRCRRISFFTGRISSI